jgi:hypothetical protein
MEVRRKGEEQGEKIIRKCGKKDIHDVQRRRATPEQRRRARDHEHPQVREEKCEFTKGIGKRRNGEEQGLRTIHSCGKRFIHHGQGIGARRKGEEQGQRPSANTGRKAHLDHGEDNHRRVDMGGSSVDAFPEQVKAVKVKTRAVGGEVSKARCPAGRRSPRKLRKTASINDRPAAPATSKSADEQGDPSSRATKSVKSATR